MISYTRLINEKSTIGENNLRLNIVANIGLMLLNLILLFIEWFMHTVQFQQHVGEDPTQFFISIFSVRIEPAGTRLDTSDFLDQCKSFQLLNNNDFEVVC